jgi:hypothetical protein
MLLETFYLAKEEKREEKQNETLSKQTVIKNSIFSPLSTLLIRKMDGSVEEGYRIPCFDKKTECSVELAHCSGYNWFCFLCTNKPMYALYNEHTKKLVEFCETHVPGKSEKTVWDLHLGKYKRVTGQPINLMKWNGKTKRYQLVLM